MDTDEIIRQLIRIRGAFVTMTDSGDYVGSANYDALSIAISAVRWMQWIPISERLPEKSGWYLVTAENDIGERREMVASYTPIGFWGNSSERARWKNLAWMELPLIYDGGEENGEGL